MELSKSHLAFVVAFFTVLFDSQFFGSARPSSRQDVWGEVSREDGTAARLEAEDADQEYDYQWMLSEVYTEDYLEVIPTHLGTCPSMCTCTVDTVVHCSRQGISAIGGVSNNTQPDVRALTGTFPDSAQIVHLGYNNITRLPRRLFHDVVNKSGNIITTLHLQNNMINTVDPDAFVGLMKLEQLDLSNNLITHFVQGCEDAETADDDASLVPDSVALPAACSEQKSQANFLLSVSESLRILNLNRNNIRGIPNYSFVNLKSLEILSLSWNRITWISRKAFFGLHKLKVLQLRSNTLGPKTAAKLNVILDHFVTGTEHVMEDDEVTSDLNGFVFYPSVTGDRKQKRYTRRHKHVRNARRRKRDVMDSSTEDNRIRRQADTARYRTIPLNSLEDLDLGNTSIDKFPSSLPSSLLRLYLDSNFISEIPAKTIRKLPHLEILQLGKNRIQQIENSLFFNMRELQILDLSRNDIAKLSPRSFDGLDRLISLRLNGNHRLSSLPKQLFWSMPFLRLVYLQDCNLQNLPSGPWIYRIYAIWLYGNPINCNCSTLLSILTRFYHPPSHILRLDPYRSAIWDDGDVWEQQRPVKTICAQPDHFRGYRMQDVRISDMRCTGEDWYNVHYARSLANVNFVTREYRTVPEEGDVTSKTKRTPIDGEYSDMQETLGEDQWGDNDIAWMEKLASELPEIDGENDPFRYSSEMEYADVEITNMSSSIPYDDEKSLTDGQDYGYLNPPLNTDIEEVATEHSTTHETSGSRRKVPKLNGATDEPEDLEAVLGGAGGWVFSLPEGTMVENPSKINGEEIDFPRENSPGATAILDGHDGKTGGNESDTITDDEHLSSGFYPTEIGSEFRDTSETESHSPWNRTEQVVPMVDDDSIAESTINDGEMEGEHGTVPAEQYLQGFARYGEYDDGVVSLDTAPAASFEEEAERTMDADELREYRKHIQDFSTWESYVEYYADPGYSGDARSSEIDDDNFYDYTMANDIYELQRSGASAEEAMRTLSNTYNISFTFHDDDIDMEPNFMMKSHDSVAADDDA